MNENKEVTFQDTIEWASLQGDRKVSRGGGMPIFYLVLGAVVILILLILIVYLTGRNPDNDMDTLDMMGDSKYILYDNDTEYEVDGDGDAYGDAYEHDLGDEYYEDDTGIDDMN